HFELARAGELSGLALLVGAELAPGIDLRTRLGRASNWTIPVLPITGMPALAAGTRVDMTVELDRTGILAWSARWPQGEAMHARALQHHLLGVPPPAPPTLRERVVRRLKRYL